MSLSNLAVLMYMAHVFCVDVLLTTSVCVCVCARAFVYVFMGGWTLILAVLTVGS